MPEGGAMPADPRAPSASLAPVGIAAPARAAASTLGAVDARAVARARWTAPSIAFACAIVAVLAIYREAVVDLVDGWSRSGTFAHGYIIFPVSAWLVWRIRDRLAALVPCTQPWALVPLVACGVVWLVGDAAGVHASAQYALVATVPCLVWGLFGNAVTRAILFPLVFLFFAVPVGDFLMPTLIERTADFTVLALRVSGVPVFREGNFFSIPSGNWSVVEACSGLRYLIASVTLGCLFAYLNYRSPVRRAAFIVASFLVPIVANWLRAYLIVMLAHLSSNALATGVDHLIYGWLFFGLVMLLLFWVGNFWREDDEPAVEHEPAAGSNGGPAGVRPSSRGAIAAMAAASIAVIAPWPAAAALLERIADAPRPGAIGFDAIDGWSADAVPFTSFVPHYQRARSTYDATFAAMDAGAGTTKDRSPTVRLFAAYYSGQAANGPLVTWHNDVVLVSDTTWTAVARRATSVEAGGRDMAIVETQLRGETGRGTERLLTWRWYWVNGRVTTSDYAAKAWTALDKLLGRGDDSAVIVLSTPIEGSDTRDAEATLAAFTRAAEPRIAAGLARVHDAARPSEAVR